MGLIRRSADSCVGIVREHWLHLRRRAASPASRPSIRCDERRSRKQEPGFRIVRPLFPAVPLYSGPAGLLSATNLIDVTPSFGLRFPRSVGLALELASFWRESLADAVYSPFNTLLRAADPTAGRYVASAPSATISWKATQHVSYSVIYSRFWPGTYFLKEPPDRNVNYFTIWASYRF
jgi:hypothetical protein